MPSLLARSLLDSLRHVTQSEVRFGRSMPSVLEGESSPDLRPRTGLLAPLYQNESPTSLVAMADKYKRLSRVMG